MSATTSTRRDGRTAATVPDSTIASTIRQLWGEAARRGGYRPSWPQIRGRLRDRGFRCGDGRIQAIVATLEAAGELPPLPATRQQAGGRKAKTIEREGAAARAGASALGRTAERNDHAARARAIRVENERASRDRRPRPAVPAVREWVREARRAERRLGIGR